MTGSRRLSQAISEGAGISILVEVSDRAGATAAESDGAHGIVLAREAVGVRDATALPLLWAGASTREAHGAGADAVVLTVEDEEHRLEELYEEAHELGLECVLRVSDEEQLELALERIDPEVLLLAVVGGDEADRLERLLELLPDVPAGKLAIAELRDASRDEVLELERAGIDAVLVDGAPAQR